jgi:hypothetical protein
MGGEGNGTEVFPEKPEFVHGFTGIPHENDKPGRIIPHHRAAVVF